MSISAKRLFKSFLPGLLMALGIVVVSCSSSPASPIPSTSADSTNSGVIPVYGYEVIHSYPHDRNAYTQGLVFEQGALYEGTGLFGGSSLRKVDLATGNVLQILQLPSQYFGEGMTICGDKIVQLTWRSNVGFVYDKESFELLRQFYYSTEGWGITYDGKRLVMSDGTFRLYFMAADTFQVTGSIEVYDEQGPVTRLNELEYIGGEIYANVWQTDRIARIAPETGKVTGWIELKGLLNTEPYSEPVDTLNGIAYDSENDRLFVTGKLWPRLFEVRLVRIK